MIVQARMSSARLPNKVLYKINDKPLLKYLLERLKKVKDGEVLIACSKRSDDNKIAKFCHHNNITCFR